MFTTLKQEGAKYQAESHDGYEETTFNTDSFDVSEIMHGIECAEVYFNDHRHEMNRPEKRSFTSNIYHYISTYGDLADPDTRVLFPTEKSIAVFKGNTLGTLINLKKINVQGIPNDYFKLVNQNLMPGGYYICCAETLKSHSRLVLSRYPRALAKPVSLIDFMLNRVFPKTILTRNICMMLPNGKNKVLSWTEIAGRFTAGGFKLVECRDIDNITFFVGKKVKAPVYNGISNCGALIKLKRVGKDGKIIYVYKLRTMHSYAEYLQEYAYEKNGVIGGGKIMDDFRVTRWGRFLRKFWIDEQPMWLNLLRGDLKLVGVRPLSEHKLSVYPEDLRASRLKCKPGLFPPYYADLPNSDEELFYSEKRYLDAYEKNPLATDLRYLFSIVYNIFIKRARSA